MLFLTSCYLQMFLNTTVCDLLPSFLEPECAALVDEYFPIIAQKIFSGYPASVICKDIGLCSSSNSTKMVEIDHEEKEGAIECLVCRLVVNAAEEELNNQATEEDIEVSESSLLLLVSLMLLFFFLCSTF